MSSRRLALLLCAVFGGLTSRATGASTLGPQTPGLSTRVCLQSETAYLYPTPSVAVGPTQALTIINGRLRTVSRVTGLPDGALDRTTDQFFAPVMTPVGGGVTLSYTLDPQVRYDRLTNRWIIAMLNGTLANTQTGYGDSRLLIAISDATSAGTISTATSWRFEWIPSSSGLLYDGLTIGIDASALYLGVRRFETTFSTYFGENLIVVRKSSLLNAAAMVVTTFPNAQSPAALPDFLQPVDNPDPLSNEGYVAALGGTGQLRVQRVLDPGGAPSLSPMPPVAIPVLLSPIPVAHLGNTRGTRGELAGGALRLSNASLRGGRLWCAATSAVDATGAANEFGGNPRNGVRWYELSGVRSMDASAPSLAQSGTIYDPAPTVATARQYWFPSIAVSGQGHVAVGFSSSGAPYRVDAGTTGRLSSDPQGTMRAPILLTNSTSAYDPPLVANSPRRHWGLSSGTAVDPFDDMTMWTLQQYCDSANTWACRLVRLDAPPPALPSSVGTAEAGLAQTTVTVSAQAPSGEAFFDPGANLPPPALPFRHLSAQVTNAGATGTPPLVTGVTVLSPTLLDLHLDTRLADPNVGAEKYTLIVRNPDGQQVVAPNALRVVPRVNDASPGHGVLTGLRGITPNPARFGTRVSFALAEAGVVEVHVIDAQGRTVATLGGGRFAAGQHTLTWDGRGAASTTTTPGLYFVRFRAHGVTDVRRVVVVR